jgi:preprotein translocase subunit SecG
MIQQLLPIVQILVAIALAAFILLQQRGGGLGSAFGGGDGSQYMTRRGIQQKLYWATIILAISFIGLALLNLILS